MKQVCITASTDPRLNVGYVYGYTKISPSIELYSSLGGKMSVKVYTDEHIVAWDELDEEDYRPMAADGPSWANEMHVRIGERYAADIWKDAYAAGDELEDCDDASAEFLTRWKSGAFRYDV